MTSPFSRIDPSKLVTLKEAIQVETKQQAEDLKRMMEPKQSGVVHGPIVGKADDSPWGNSPEWQELAEDYREKQKAAIETPAHSPNHTEVSLAADKARTAMNDKQVELRESALAAGIWNEADENIRAAQQSLSDKAGDIIKRLT